MDNASSFGFRMRSNINAIRTKSHKVMKTLTGPNTALSTARKLAVPKKALGDSDNSDMAESKSTRNL